MKKNIWSLIFLIIAVLSFTPVIAQSNQRIHEQLRFKYLTIDDGLQSNKVRALCQDNYGYIWIGSRLGISRFDGYEVKSYDYFYNDTAQVHFSESREIFLDKNNKLWAVGGYGITYYDIDKDKFIQFKHKDLTIDINSCNGIDQDSEGNIWFGAREGLIKYNTKSNALKLIEQVDGDPKTPPTGTFMKIIVTERNHVWFILEKDGAGYYNPESGSYNYFTPNESESSLAELKTERLYEDKSGNIWIGHNNKGISKYSYETNSFTRYFPEPGRKESGRVRGILEDSKGNFWFGTQAGLYLFDTYNESFKRYAYTQHPISTLSHNSIQTMMIDNQDGLWMGTFAGGVSYTSLNTSGIVLYEYNNIASEYYLNDKNVYSIAFDNDHNIWLGTENGGLNYLNREEGTFKYYTNVGDPLYSPASNNIKDIIIDKNNKLWLATYRGGMDMLDLNTGSFTHYLKSEDNPTGIPDKSVYILEQDPLDENILWVGGIDNNYIFNKQDETFTLIETDMYEYENAYTIGRINDSYIHSGKIYFATENGIAIVDGESKSISHLSNIGNEELGQVRFIFIDHRNVLWAGFVNKSRLLRYDLKLKMSEYIDKKKGLPDISYLAGTNDDIGNIWLTSNQGLWKLEGIVNSTDSFNIEQYDRSDNVQSLEFLYHSLAKSNDGEILVGGINGFNSFYPENVKPNPFKPTVIINKLSIGGIEVKANEKVLGKILLDESITTTTKLHFHHKIKLFRFDFTGTHFVSPDNNKFKYKLEGFDDDWHYSNANARSATYSNIPRGKYTFIVNATNNNGLWSDNPVEIEIKVSPPFWKTLWFYSLVLVIIILLVRLFIQWREGQLQEDKKQLETQLEKGKQEIEDNKAQVAKQEEELRLRDIAEHESRWHNKGIISLGDVITKNKNNVNQLATSFIGGLIEYLESHQGAVYLINDADEDDKYFEIVASYAFNKNGKTKIGINEGLLGVCYKDKKVMILNDIPQNYTKISSGLGSTAPKLLLLVPLMVDEEVIGLLEISSIKQLEQYQISFTETICATFASNLFTLITNSKVEDLLSKSREQAEELKEQEEEMRQSMEEMMATREEAERRESELLKMDEEKEAKLTEFRMILKEKEEELDKIHEQVEAKEKEIEELKENLGK